MIKYCSECEFNRSIALVGDGVEHTYICLCTKAGATRSIWDLKPHWCPIDGTGDPYPYFIRPKVDK